MSTPSLSIAGDWTIPEETVTTIPQASGLSGRAVFPLPSAIVADQPSRTSEPAKQLLAAAIALCRPRRPGFVVGSLADDELQVLAASCHALTSRVGSPPEAPTLLSDDERSFDRFFGIARHDSSDAFAIGIAWGLIAMLHEVSRPHSLIPAELAALMSGFYRLAEAFLPPVAGERPPMAAADGKPTRHRHAIERWRNGHLTFVALTDGLIFAHVRATSAIERQDAAAAVAALRDASCLFAASGAAMRLTGDMAPEDYDRIRAIMSPPRVPEGFSGLFDADHRYLLHLTKRLGILLNQEWQEIAWAREEYWLALNDVYSAHRWVCQKLVGKAPSLATASKLHEQPAPEKLEAFARRALRIGGYMDQAGSPRD
jgi:hypothetical protein